MDALERIFTSLEQEPQPALPEAPPGQEWMLVTVSERLSIEARRIRHERKRNRYRAPKKFKVTPEIKRDMANNMIASPTHAERKLRDALKAKNVNFRTQEIMLGYIADFYFPERRMIVEVDGGIHAITKERDAIRDRVFRSHRIGVLRVSNQNVLQDVDAVVKEIMKCPATPSP
jgi:very-short-patch-repair endonuclease